MDAESLRLAEDASRDVNWKRWGPYLSERQWGTVREDYSASGNCWEYFPHDHARSRAYRWGEDGLLGITDRECRLCFSLALWNGRDPILKERLFGLTNGEGNHGEDVKECYYYLDATPTGIVSARRSTNIRRPSFPTAGWWKKIAAAESSIRNSNWPTPACSTTTATSTCSIEYAKDSPNDILIRITAANRGPNRPRCICLPTLVVSQHLVLGLQA